MKYIHFQNHGIIIFSSQIPHITVASKFAADIPLGAGFITRDFDGNRICSGYSSSLKIGVGETDSEKLLDMGIY